MSTDMLLNAVLEVVFKPELDRPVHHRHRIFYLIGMFGFHLARADRTEYSRPYRDQELLTGFGPGRRGFKSAG